MLTYAEKKAKREWLHDLRSGKYKQETNTLYSPVSKGFCCLGVLQHRVLKGLIEVENESDMLEFNDAPAYGAQPSSMFYENFPQFAWVRVHESELIEMNDEQHMTFEQIADFVQENWK